MLFSTNLPLVYFFCVISYFFNKFTNVKLNNKLIVADVYELGEENLKYGMYIFTELFWDKIKENRKNACSVQFG